MGFEDALPTSPGQSELEISENDIDDIDFSKELPFESEYYRTSTDRDVFVRPIPNPDVNEIDDGEDGIDLDEPGTFVHTPNCTYHIAIKLFYESIDDLDIKLEGLTVKSGPKNNISLNEFLKQTQVQMFDKIKGKNLTNELVNDIINNLRQTFSTVYGYEDNCGVSTTVITYFTKNDTQVDTPQINDETTEIPIDDDNQSETVIPNFQTTTDEDEDEDDVTEKYQSRTLIKPKLSAIIQDAIDFYKALNNWRYSQQA